MEKPRSVLDAELRFNIADWGNEIHFVSSFVVPEGVPYLCGPVAHGLVDLSRPGTQVWVASQWMPLIRCLGDKTALRHDVFVSPRAGNA
jgi:hypothetical protein